MVSKARYLSKKIVVPHVRVCTCMRVSMSGICCLSHHGYDAKVLNCSMSRTSGKNMIRVVESDECNARRVDEAGQSEIEGDCIDHLQKRDNKLPQNRP